MAVAIQSYKNTSDAASSTSLTISGFSSLAVGDLLIAQFTLSMSTASSRTITLPSGWTLIDRTSQSTTLSTEIAYKIADSSDVSGNSFTFQYSGAAGNAQLAGVRITGHRNVSSIATSSGTASASSTTVNVNTVTPALADSLLMFFVTGAVNATVNGYTVTTSPPTFTETYDLNNASITNSLAAGVRPETTATGSGTATLSSAGTNIGQLVVVSPPQVISASDTVTTTENVSTLRGLIFSVLDTVVTSDSITTQIARLWTKVTRNIKSWTNSNR